MTTLMQPGGLKAGWQTSEFWASAMQQVLTLVVLLGIIPTADLDKLHTAFAAIITAVGVLLVNGGVVVNYIRGRVELKKQAAEVPVPAEPEVRS